MTPKEEQKHTDLSMSTEFEKFITSDHPLPMLLAPINADIVKYVWNAALATRKADFHEELESPYYAWLIEQRGANGKPTWLCNQYFPEFTDNAWEALHFGRKRDAEAYADSETHDLYITEHAFSGQQVARATNHQSEG